MRVCELHGICAFVDNEAEITKTRVPLQNATFVTVKISTSHTDSRRLIVADFDGTLTWRDSFVGFLNHAVPLWKRLLWFPYSLGVTVVFAIGLLDNGRAKEVMLMPFFRGVTHSAFCEKADRFGRGEWLENSIRTELLNHLLQAKLNGNTVAIVSASLGAWIRPWCEQHGFICISSEHEVLEGVVTGRLATPNCYGDEKVRRIESEFNLADYCEIEAWGNSRGDREMLAMAHIRFYKGKQQDS